MPTHDVDEDGPDDGTSSKKDRVIKKWNRLKKVRFFQLVRLVLYLAAEALELSNVILDNYRPLRKKARAN